MPRTARKNFNSGFFHIMIQGINKEYIFQDKYNKEKYINFMKKYYTEYKINIVSYCIMDNHAHFIIYTEDINEISNYMHKVNSVYAIYYNNKLNRVGYVFRNRYNSQYIDNQEYLLKCIKYIHMNPVKAHMVNKENQYPYSSYNDFINKKGYIDDSIIEKIFKKQNYLEIFTKIDAVDIEIMDIDNNNENFENAVKKYLNENKFKLDDIKKDKDRILKFSLVLISKGYKQKQIAKKLEVSPSKVSRIIKDRYLD